MRKELVFYNLNEFWV